MGTFKAYGGLRALNYFRFASGNLERNCPPYYVMNSNIPIIGIMGQETTSSNNNAAANGMYSIVAYATADELEDYNIDDYTVTALGTTTCTLSMNSVSGSVTATVSMAANSDTTIKCIKFVSTKGWFGQRQDQWSNAQWQNILMCGYFFDEPIVLDASNNYSAEVVINFHNVV